MSGQDLLRNLVVTPDPNDITRIEQTFTDTRFTTEKTWSNSIQNSLEYVQQNDPDLVIVDHQLNGTTGFEFANRCTGRGFRIPMIMMGERDDAAIVRKAFRTGFYDYVPKDELSPKELERSIDFALKKNEKERELRELARTDELTGLLNRRGMVERLKGELKRSMRENSRFSLLLLDVDNFKDVNDRYGHVTGDRILEQIATMIDEKIRDSDFAVRYGGDEFLVGAPDTGLQGICQLGERILQSLEQLTVSGRRNQNEIRCSISAGCSSFNGEEHDRIKEEEENSLIEQADSALYVAKEKGGAMVERRTSKRHMVGENDREKIDTDIIFDDEHCEGNVRDYSKTGVRVQTDKDIPEEESVNLRLSGSRLTTSEVEVSGTVAWSRSTESGGCEAGIYVETELPL